MWEIRESDGSKYGHKMGMREDKSVQEAYECGFEDGYETAMEEMKYGERSSYRMGKRRY
jgi:hypothetical protein